MLGGWHCTVSQRPVSHTVKLSNVLCCVVCAGSEPDWVLDLVATGFEKDAQLFGHTMRTTDDVDAAADAFKDVHAKVSGLQTASNCAAGSLQSTERSNVHSANSAVMCTNSHRACDRPDKRGPCFFAMQGHQWSDDYPACLCCITCCRLPYQDLMQQPQPNISSNGSLTFADRA
jgi:hypothetical protein